MIDNWLLCVHNWGLSYNKAFTCNSNICRYQLGMLVYFSLFHIQKMIFCPQTLYCVLISSKSEAKFSLCREDKNGSKCKWVGSWKRLSAGGVALHCFSKSHGIESRWSLKCFQTFRLQMFIYLKTGYIATVAFQEDQLPCMQVVAPQPNWKSTHLYHRDCGSGPHTAGSNPTKACIYSVPFFCKLLRSRACVQRLLCI